MFFLECLGVTHFAGLGSTGRLCPHRYGKGRFHRLRLRLEQRWTELMDSCCRRRLHLLCARPCAAVWQRPVRSKHECPRHRHRHLTCNNGSRTGESCAAPRRFPRAAIAESGFSGPRNGAFTTLGGGREVATSMLSTDRLCSRHNHIFAGNGYSSGVAGAACSYALVEVYSDGQREVL